MTEKDELINKSIELWQDKCVICSAASVTDAGYPRISILKPIAGQGINTIYFLMGGCHENISDYKKNPKASITFYNHGDSVSLVGNVTILKDLETDENLYRDWIDQQFFETSSNYHDYSVLKFVSQRATVYFDGKCETFDL